MKTNFKILLLVISVAFMFITCNKDDKKECCTCSTSGTICEDDYQGNWEDYKAILVNSLGCTCDGIIDTNNTTDLLCDGSSSNSYWPLELDNEWSYNGEGNLDMIVNVTGTQSSGGKTWFQVLTDEQGLNQYTQLFRTETNGDIMLYSSSTEYLHIPASPSTNQQWAHPAPIGTGTRKVISTNASISTSNCSYTGCLQITQYNDSGSALSTYYYKKGIGLVKSTISSFSHTDLIDVTLN